MKRFFISDMHFFHNKIIHSYGRKGKFQSLEEMHEHMINTWNKHVKKVDLVYIVGDFSFGTKEETRDILSRLSGRKILIVGNHDRRSKRHIKIREYIEIGFDSVMDEDVINLSNDIPVLLKHYPYEIHSIKMFWMKLTRSLGPFKTYYAFYPVDKGLWHIHGHIHGGQKINGRQINVSVDTWDYRPVSESEICRIINSAESKKLENRLKYFFRGLKGKFLSAKNGVRRYLNKLGR